MLARPCSNFRSLHLCCSTSWRRVRGERMVTDPRQHVSRGRLEFWELANFLRQRFGDKIGPAATCRVRKGRRRSGPKFMKNHCEKTDAGMHLVLDQRLFQKKGMQYIDPNTGALQPQAFESGTRFEMYDATLP